MVASQEFEKSQKIGRKYDFSIGVPTDFTLQEREDADSVSITISPKFRNPSELTFEQLTDPDYALKQLEESNQYKLAITCSKCHHCR